MTTRKTIRKTPLESRRDIDVRVYDASSSLVSTVTNKSGRFKTVKNPTKQYGFAEYFAPSEYDLKQISVLEDGESYVRQAFQKMTSLMFKEGEVYTGLNDETIGYIKKRIRQMEYVTKTPWRTLLRETGYSLISKSNYFWVKVRNENASGGKKAFGARPPVAGYFGMAPETVRIKKDKDGKIIKYRQELWDGRWKEFNPEDIIHFSAYKKTGFLFGTPRITSVIEDIYALRRLEENVEIMFYQILFPLFHYTVGTEMAPAGKVKLPDGSTMSEVEYVRAQVESMPSEGGFVTPERHKIEYIGAAKEVPNYKQLLDYYKQRVLSGLGLSSVDIGEGDTANRATADSLSKALIDSVKDYQNIFEDIINSQVVPELLLESPFKGDVLSEDNMVNFKFKEIDIEQQLKKNVNAQLMYNADIFDINEAREIAGKQPLEKWQEKLMFTERQALRVSREDHKNNIEIAQINHENSLVQAEHGATLAPQTEKTSTTTGGGKKTVTKTLVKPSKKAKAAANSAKNSSAPTNQHGTKTGPQKSRLDRLIRNETRLLENLAETVSADDLRNCAIAAKNRLIAKSYSLQLDKEEAKQEIMQNLESWL
jgi:hypothetical protein